MEQQIRTAFAAFDGHQVRFQPADRQAQRTTHCCSKVPGTRGGVLRKECPKRPATPATAGLEGRSSNDSSAEVRTQLKKSKKPLLSAGCVGHGAGHTFEVCPEASVSKQSSSSNRARDTDMLFLYMGLQL